MRPSGTHTARVGAFGAASAVYGRFVVIAFLVAAGLSLAVLRYASSGATPAPPLVLETGLIVGLGAAFLLIWRLGRLTLLAPHVALVKAQRSLARSEAAARRLALAAEAATDLILICSADGRISWANPAFRKVVGMSEQECRGAHLSAVLADEGPGAGAREACVEALRTGGVFSGLVSARDGYGKLRLLDVVTSPARDPSGGIEKIVLVMRDVTSIRAAERRMRDAVNLLDDSFMLLDPEGRLILCNEAFRRLLGQKDALRPGLSFDELARLMREHGVVTFTETEASAWIEESLDQLRVGSDVATYRAPNGAAYTLRSRTLETGEIVALLIDVTQLETARERAEATAEAKARFLANVAHEVRTPLNGVIAMAELLLDTDLDQEQRRGAALISRSGDALLTVINDLMDHSKIEAGRMTLAPAPFDPAEMIEDAVGLLRPKAAEKGLNLIVETHLDLRTLVLGDIGRIRQIALNLLGNALKFTEAGDVSVNLTSVSDATGAALKLTVADQGVGVSPRQMKRIFAPFEQDETLDALRQQEGTGLGLSISRQLAALMGGNLSATSEIGVGSTFEFTVRLPLCDGAPVLVIDDGGAETGRVIRRQLAAMGRMRPTDGEEGLQIFVTDGGAFESPQPAALDPARPVVLIAPPGPPPPWLSQLAGRLSAPVTDEDLAAALRRAEMGETAAPAPAAQQTALGPRIMAVEDNATNAAVLTALLRDVELTIDVYGRAEEALEAFALSRPDFVLLDLNLPDLDGYETARRIRAAEMDAGAPRTPIIAATAHAVDEVRARCLEAGMDDVISKPFRKPLLDAAIGRWLPELRRRRSA